MTMKRGAAKLRLDLGNYWDNVGDLTSTNRKKCDLVRTRSSFGQSITYQLEMNNEPAEARNNQSKGIVLPGMKRIPRRRRNSICFP